MTVSKDISDKADRRHRWFVVVVCCLAMVVFAMSSQILPAGLEPMGREFQRDLSQRGILFLLGAVGFVISTLLSGRLSDRYGQRGIVVCGMTMLAGGLFFTAWAPNWILVQTGIFLLGISGGFIESPVSSAAVEAFPDQRGQVMNAVQVFFNVGAVLGPAIMGLTLWTGWGWRWGFGILCILTAASAILVHFGLPSRPHKQKEETGIPDAPIPYALVAALSLAIFFYVGSELNMAQWSANYLVASFGVPAARATLVVSLFWFSMMAGRIVYVFIVGRFGFLIPPIVSAVLAAGTMAWAMLAGSGLSAAIACAATGLCLGGTWPTVVGYAAQCCPARTGTVLSIVIAAGSLGSMLLPPLAGWVSQHSAHGLRAAMGMSLVFIVLEGLVLFGIWLHERRARAR